MTYYYKYDDVFPVELRALKLNELDKNDKCNFGNAINFT